MFRLLETVLLPRAPSEGSGIELRWAGLALSRRYCGPVAEDKWISIFRR